MFEIILKFYAIINCFKIIETNSILNISSSAVLDNKTFHSNASERNFNFLIAGGVHAAPNKDLKYMVSIRTRNPQRFFGDNHYCAGTIISKTAVLTAAHCVME